MMRVPRGEVWWEPANFLQCWGCLFWFPEPVKTDQRAGSGWSPSVFKTQSGLYSVWSLSTAGSGSMSCQSVIINYCWNIQLTNYLLTRSQFWRQQKSLCEGKIYKYHVDNQKISRHWGSVTQHKGHLFSVYWSYATLRLCIYNKDWAFTYFL